MFDMKKFADFLSAKRKNKGLTQDQLSDLVGVTHQAVSKWERGEAMPEISKIGDLSKALGVQTDEVIACMYAGEEIKSGTESKRDADAEYYALADKSSVGDVYYLAPDLTKETLRIAIDTVISAKGTRAASMLFQFADEEYLHTLASQLLSNGDTGLVEYADEKSIKRAVVNFVTTADLCPDRYSLEQNYKKAGETLIYSKDEDFINETFKHTVDATGNWNVWRHIINRFPPEVLAEQGIKHMIRQGTSSFNGWWELIGRRVATRMFIGYADHFGNNAQAWKDIAIYYEQSDKAMMESAIKERIEKCDPSVFTPLLSKLSEETKKLLREKGVKDYIPDQVREAINFSNSVKNQLKQYGRNNSYINRNNFNDIVAEIEGRLSDIENRLDELEGRIDDCEEFDDRIDELDGKIDDFDGKIDDINDKMDDINDKIDEFCE
ncbi:MAG: helix-turn-helix domain-containing protein [Eubacteriales bacterium]|nr:helix-turn-helix domain-containing protein [Eubacteriales bacterium]